MIELVPDTLFEYVNKEGPLHVVMYYGATCGPCKVTLPHYELLYNHFVEHNITNIKFYKFHAWEQDFQEFINKNNLRPRGVPCFRYYYNGELVAEDVAVYNDANILKKKVLDVCDAIHVTMGGFSLYETT